MFSILGRFIAYILLLAFLIFSVVFALSNAMNIEVNYLFGIKELSLPILLLISLSVGVLLGSFGMLSKLFKLRHINKHHNKEIKILEEELAKLNIPPDNDN